MHSDDVSTQPHTLTEFYKALPLKPHPIYSAL